MSLSSLASFFQELGIHGDVEDDGIAITVLAKTGAKKESLSLGPAGELKVAVTARPVEGKANRAIKKLLASKWGMAKSGVTLLKGEKSERKRVDLRFSFTGSKTESYYREKIKASLS